MVVSEQCFYDCFVQIVGLHSQMEQISASSVENVFIPIQVHTMHICLFFVANSQTTCMNTERSRVNDEFFVHLQCKVLETQRLHQILRLNWKQALMNRRFRSITSIATLILMTKKSLHFFLNATTTRWVTVHCYNNRAMRVKIWVKLLGAWWGIGKDSVNRIWALWISIVPSCALSQ